MNERLEQLRRFQKCLRRAVEASTPGEAEAAEAAARRIMKQYNIDPLKITDKSLYDCTTFEDNVLLLKLREEHHVLRQQEKQKRKSRYLLHNLLHTLTNPVTRSVSRDEDRVECLRQLLNTDKSRSNICKEHGYKQGEISGIIRDYTGAKSAHRRFQDNPKWIAVLQNGRVVYDLRKEKQHHEQDHSSGDTSARAVGGAEGSIS